MIGRVFIGIIAFILLVSFASAITAGIKTWRTNDVTQSSVVATGAGESTANVTLSRALYQDDVTEVIGFSSNLTESPVASSYDADTQVLLVAALNVNTSRTLSINHYSELEDNVMQALGPFLTVLLLGGCAGAILYGIFKGGRR